MQEPRRRALSLHPLQFEEAVTDLLKIKPEPKQPKKAKPTKTRSQIRKK